MNVTEQISLEDYLNSLRAKPKKLQKKRARVPALQIGAGTVDGITELLFMGVVPGMNGKNGLIRMHHRKKKQLRDRYQQIAMAHRAQKHIGPVRVELVRHSIGGKMDYPNLVSTEKLLLDAIVLAKILPDDKDEIIQERSYEQTRALNKDSQFTTIRIINLQPITDTYGAWPTNQH